MSKTNSIIVENGKNYYTRWHKHVIPPIYRQEKKKLFVFWILSKRMSSDQASHRKSPRKEGETDQEQECESAGLSDAGTPKLGGGDLPPTVGKKYYAVDFTFGEVLGEGAFGAVMKVTLKDTGKDYAIKVMDKKHIMKENKVKYVKTERNILAMCKHPNIVSMFCTFSDPNHLYYVLELCPNGELLTWLKKVGSFDLASARFYSAEIVAALQYLHQRNVIHRDLKPENLLFAQNMHLKLTDFGTSKELEGGDTLARSNSFVGTAEYVCPELLNVKETSGASDLWALGVIVFQLLTGRMAFHGATQYLTFQNVLHRRFSFPQQPFDPHAKDLIEQLLQLDPAARLGAGPGGYDRLKAHPFFEGIDWLALPDTIPPEIKASSTQWTWEGEESPPAFCTSTSTTGASTGGVEAVDPASSDALTSSTSSPASSSAQTPMAYDVQATEAFSKHLIKGERVLKSGVIYKRRRISVRKRHLLLTSTPRLVYIDPTSDETKGEIPISAEMKIEVKSSKSFVILTPGRKWNLEDANKNAQLWASAIKVQLSKF